YLKGKLYLPTLLYLNFEARSDISERKNEPTLNYREVAPMTVGTGRAGHIMLALGRGLVVAGGLQPLWMGFGDQLFCELYNTTHDSWSSIPALPRPHLSPGATVLGGRLYVVGGSSANTDTSRDNKGVHRYDPMEGCWENLGSMPHPYTNLLGTVGATGQPGPIIFTSETHDVIRNAIQTLSLKDVGRKAGMVGYSWLHYGKCRMQCFWSLTHTRH
uniref:Uncharacterized protein n=1 Tax=Sander lucioperca TaxID=283035 RepID=A0A8C9X894_SANLU